MRCAAREWYKLGETVKEQFKSQLAVVLENLHIESSRLTRLL
ncbi:hypothetical protein HMPREF1570_2345 [Klebsiella oxytoca KA-2]|nr:hypothetical protein HMPREF1570_2345 [Klebsiella oxytoca KA-2]EUC89989.1 hypothetical protein HMPREF1569_1767 [Klebsiella oxytoca OK-1]